MFHTHFRSATASGVMAVLALFNTAVVMALPSATACSPVFTISGISGGFSTHTLLDFSTQKAGGNAASFLSSHGIMISDYPVGSTPVAHDFSPSAVSFGQGALNLKVSAYVSSQGSVHGAEIVTNSEFLYGSMRTVMKSSAVPGIVEGIFFYRKLFVSIVALREAAELQFVVADNDTQETDWEILTSTTLKASADVPAGIWTTNQNFVLNQPSNHETVPLSFDPSQGFHEYRIDWVPGSTTFYLDGVQKTKLTTFTPVVAAHLIWNVWSSGDPEWSNGPPTSDSVTQIRSIEYYTGYCS
ncbi:hypothetical protein D9619_011712 [Psilocybe cf. subviscida]|uniref:GH16 domain-containing protein n=1 Tax=Psilocybe cf. subviscida TaxID=2480587 RepID=A0A8H5BT04_9AGAR|nr:hypothetical protein D9619_011712 [Psilocybe cf. subviscida]